jgi:hypothetical protein
MRWVPHFSRVLGARSGDFDFFPDETHSVRNEAVRDVRGA